VGFHHNGRRPIDVTMDSLNDLDGNSHLIMRIIIVEYNFVGLAQKVRSIRAGVLNCACVSLAHSMSSFEFVWLDKPRPHKASQCIEEGLSKGLIEL
jgi:hypothetical protein